MSHDISDSLYQKYSLRGKVCVCVWGGVLCQNFIFVTFTICCRPIHVVSKEVTFVIRSD